MRNLLNCIMLVDDDTDDNFYHERVIKKNDANIFVVAMQSVVDAIGYLKMKKEHIIPHPDLIFLDINMPGMNGWEFLKEYDKLDKDFQCQAVVVMLTTSDNPDDKIKAHLYTGISEFQTKPLTKVMLEAIYEKYFS